MEFKIGYINVIAPNIKIPRNEIPVLFLHGFTGCANDWDNIIKFLPNQVFPICIDFIGHGKSDLPEDVSFYETEAIIDQIKSVYEFFDIEKAVIVGYSMGGRVALSFVVKNPHQVLGLILESTSPGIMDIGERAQRKKSDKELAQIIMDNGVDKFIDYWMTIPLFDSLKSLKNDEYQRIVTRKKNNSKIGLSNSLLGFGTGTMSQLWDNLTIQTKILLITGGLDSKFCELNKKMNRLMLESQHTVIENCGHNVHLEKPDEFIILVNKYLKEIRE